MGNPAHSAKTEAALVEVEAIRQAHYHLKRDGWYVDADLTPAYKRDVLNALAERYRKRCDELGVDYLPIVEED